MPRTLILLPPLLVFLLISLGLTSISLLTSAQTLGLDTFLSDQFLLDPLAVNDSISFMPSSIKKSLSTSPLFNTKSLISQLFSFQIAVPVRVRLVGRFSAAAPSLLQSFVSASQSSSRFQVVGVNPHHLVVSHSLQLDPSLAALEHDIFEAIRSHIESSPAPLHAGALFPIPYSIVDAIIRRDFFKEESNSAPGFYIFLLNLNQQSRRYAYSYDSKDSSPAYAKCFGTIWTGTERYLWIDLSAGPVDYGPALSGEGLLPRGEFHPLSSLHKGPRPEKALLGDLASLVLGAYQSLLVPSLRIPVFIDNKLFIQFIHIHGSEYDDLVDLDWNSIEKALSVNDLSFKGQILKVNSYRMKYSECAICSFAIAKSIKSYTSRFLFENYTLIVSEYLDSKHLRQVLADSVDEIHREAGISGDESGKVIPVYVFDMDHDRAILLDRFHQSVAFKDMVIAVRTRNANTVSDYSCNGRHVVSRSRDLNRAIVGSILQSMWGVAPTHLSWSPEHNKTVVDYTWSVGQTPFGPFSELASLSFVQKDAARRNVLLVGLNYTITSAVDLLESLAAYGGDRKALKDNRYVEFVLRWNLLKYKLDKVVSAMSQLDYDKALHFLRSSDHDLFALHTLLYKQTQELEASLVCFNDPSFPWASASVTGVFLFGLFYIYSKRDKIFRNKRKQF